MGVDEAKSHVIDLMANEELARERDARASVWCGLARLVRGNNPEVACALLEKGLAEPDMFTAPGYIRVWMRHRKALPTGLAERIAAMLTEGMSYEGLYDDVHTENHKVMLATTRLLVAEAFPDRRVDGTRASVAYRASLDWLRAWGESRCVYGHTEFHSPVYSMTYTMPLLNLRDCTGDPFVRRMAEMMTDYIATHHAVNHLDGMYAGGHSRSYDHTIVNTQAHPSQLWSFLFYGARSIRQRNALWLLFPAADSDYVPHPSIISAATDRSRPYSIRERHGEVVSNGVPVDIQRYTWMTDSFALSSLQGASWPDHQNRWSLKIACDNPHATVLTNQPGKSEKSGTWHGASEYEHLVQHEGAIVVTYHIPETDPHPEMIGHLPGEADEWSPPPETFAGETAPQWVFFRIGRAYCALHPLAPFRLVRKRYEGGMFEGTDFRGTEYWEIASPHRINGVVLEAGREADCGSFQEFMARIAPRGPKADPATNTVRYRSMSGAELALKNPGPDPAAPSFLQADGTVSVMETHLHYRAQRPPATITIGGVSPGYRDWPSLECPFAHSDFGSGVVHVEHGGHGLKLDFRAWHKIDW